MNEIELSQMVFRGVSMTIRRSLAIIDLSTRTIDLKPIPATWRRKFIGGRGLGTYLACRYGDAGSDPLTAANTVVVSAGLLGGTLSSSHPLIYITAKSPLTGFLETAYLPGLFAAEMRWAGFDHLVITGRSRRWVSLSIHNGSIQIMNTGHLKGEGTFAASEKLRRAQGDDDLKTITIGPAGENHVRFANIVDGAGNSAGRTGMGAVLGFKRVKALTCRGSLDLEIKYPEETICQRQAALSTARSTETERPSPEMIGQDVLAGDTLEKLDVDGLVFKANDLGMDGEAALLMAVQAAKDPADEITVLMERIALRKGKAGMLSEGPLRMTSDSALDLSRICLCRETITGQAANGDAPAFAAPPKSSAHYRGNPGRVAHRELSYRLLDCLGDRTCAGICAKTGHLDLARAAELMRLNTGSEMSPRSLQTAAYRSYALERLFNLKAARAARQAGTLGACLEAPGGLEMSLSAWERIDLAAFRKMVAQHYQRNGWDRKNVVKKNVFERLEVAELWTLLK